MLMAESVNTLPATARPLLRLFLHVTTPHNAHPAQRSIMRHLRQPPHSQSFNLSTAVRWLIAPLLAIGFSPMSQAQPTSQPSATPRYKLSVGQQLTYHSS